MAHSRINAEPLSVIRVFVTTGRGSSNRQSLENAARLVRMKAVDYVDVPIEVQMQNAEAKWED
jgi:hypothetical protein